MNLRLNLTWTTCPVPCGTAQPRIRGLPQLSILYQTPFVFSIKISHEGTKTTDNGGRKTDDRRGTNHGFDTEHAEKSNHELTRTFCRHGLTQIDTVFLR